MSVQPAGRIELFYYYCLHLKQNLKRIKTIPKVLGNRCVKGSNAKFIPNVSKTGGGRGMITFYFLFFLFSFLKDGFPNVFSFWLLANICKQIICFCSVLKAY